MDGSDLIAAFRSDMFDQVEPYLWSNEDIERYATDAQRMFCRFTDGIEDSRSAMTQLAITPNTAWYPVSPLVKKVRLATRNDNGREVAVVPVEKMQAQGMRFDGRTGPLQALISGLEKGILRAYPTPNETVTVTASVFRFPLKPVTDGSRLEVDEQHHESLLMWMKHKAYLKQDAETFDRTKADEFEAKFISYCKLATAEQERARRSAGTVIYGGL